MKLITQFLGAVRGNVAVHDQLQRKAIEQYTVLNILSCNKYMACRYNNLKIGRRVMSLHGCLNGFL